MNFDILYRPAHSMAKVQLNANESVLAESGAMIGMSPNVQMQTQTARSTRRLALLRLSVAVSAAVPSTSASCALDCLFLVMSTLTASLRRPAATPTPRRTR